MNLKSKVGLQVGGMMLLLMLPLSAWWRLPSLEELVQSSSLIVEGRVRSKYVTMEFDEMTDRDIIMTFISVNVAEVIAGEYALDSLCVRMRGGVIGERAMYSSGLYPFELGEDALLFLESIDEKSGLFRLKFVKGSKLSLVHEGKVSYYDTSQLRDTERNSFEQRTVRKDILQCISDVINGEGGQS